MKRELRVSLFRHLITAIAMAAHDVQLEARGDHRLIHFFDADFLYRAAFGYRALELAGPLVHFSPIADDSPEARTTATGPHLDQYRGLLSALTNYSRFDRTFTIPGMRSLEPHLDEWTSLVLERAPPPDRSSRRKAALKVLGAQAAFEDIRNSIRGKAHSDVAPFLDAVQRYGPELVIAFDLTALEGKERILHFLDLGIAEETALDTGQAVTRTELFAELDHRLRALRFGGKVAPYRLRPHMTDVAALAILMASVEQRPRDNEGRLVVARYYTETAPLRRLMTDDPWVSARLIYPQDHTHEEWPVETHSVIRDEYYYLLRLTIPELSFDPAVASLEDDFVKETIDVSRAAARGASHADVYAAIESVRNRAGNLATLIETVSDLSFVSRVWPKWVELEGEWLRRAVLDGGDEDYNTVALFGREHEAEIGEEVRTRLRQIERALGGIAAFSGVFVALVPAVSRAADFLQAVAGDGDVLADTVGIVRWSLLRDEDIAKCASRIVAASLESEGELWSEELARSVALIVTQGGVEDTEDIAALVLAYVIGQYDLVSKYGGPLSRALYMRLQTPVEEATTGERTSRSSQLQHRFVLTALLRLLAEFRITMRHQDSHRDSESTEEVAHRAAASVAEIAARVHAFRGSPAQALVEAYIWFETWYALNPGIETLPLDGRLARSVRPYLLEWSLAAVGPLVARRAAPEYSLVHPWLINHVLYIAVVADVDEPIVGRTIHDLAEELVALGRVEEPGHRWSYRFSDTLAMYYYLLTKRKLASADEGTRAGSEQQKTGSPVSELVRESARWIQQAQEEAHYDPTIERHAAQIRVLVGAT